MAEAERVRKPDEVGHRAQFGKLRVATVNPQPVSFEFADGCFERERAG